MIKLKENLFLSNDDDEVLFNLQSLKEKGLKIPEFDCSKDMMIPFVFYEKGFNLRLFLYFSKEKDNGWAMIAANNFMTENKFNLNQLKKFGFDVFEVLSFILSQTVAVAEKIKYPFSIGIAMTRDFIGLVATPHHPITEKEKLN